jgi:hypothetical protein
MELNMAEKEGCGIVSVGGFFYAYMNLPQNLGESSEHHVQLMFRAEPFATLEFLGATVDEDFAQPAVMTVDVIDAWVVLCVWADRDEWLAWFHSSGLSDRYEIITPDYDLEELFKTDK